MTLSHGRSFGPSLLALLTTVITWPAAGPVAAELPSGNVEYSTSQMLDDAELTDVFFLDPDQGWAVGDRGAILRTEDGGRHWQVQRVGAPADSSRSTSLTATLAGSLGDGFTPTRIAPAASFSARRTGDAIGPACRV